jgi:hypothetical protein
MPSNELDLLAASLRADAADLDAFVEGLAVKLEEALPGRVRVGRWRERVLGPKRVHRIALDASDQRLELSYKHGVIEASCSRLSGGIVLKREPLDTGAWLAALGEALSDEAKRSDATRAALERLMIR